MSGERPIAVYDSQSAAYQDAFQVFLAHTDQKIRTRDWLNRLVETLPSRKVFIDAGAGNGKVTSWYVDEFERTTAIEPNPFLCEELRETCPTAQVIPEAILEAQPESPGNLVLCSHVLYYIDPLERIRHMEKLASWTGPGGILVVIVQNHDTDCMRMLDHFLGLRFNMSELAATLRDVFGDRYSLDMALIPARVRTKDIDAAYTVAEFMLNLLPLSRVPDRRAVAAYVEEHFANSSGGYDFSCDQDCLLVRRVE